MENTNSCFDPSSVRLIVIYFKGCGQDVDFCARLEEVAKKYGVTHGVYERLHAHPEEIPAEWKTAGLYIWLPETEFCVKGYRRVRTLNIDGQRWNWSTDYIACKSEPNVLPADNCWEGAIALMVPVNKNEMPS